MEEREKIPEKERYSRSVGHRDGRVCVLENAMQKLCMLIKNQ